MYKIFVVNLYFAYLYIIYNQDVQMQRILKLILNTCYWNETGYESISLLCYEMVIRPIVTDAFRHVNIIILNYKARLTI
jgi:hypothetical protein